MCLKDLLFVNLECFFEVCVDNSFSFGKFEWWESKLNNRFGIEGMNMI